VIKAKWMAIGVGLVSAAAVWAQAPVAAPVPPWNSSVAAGATVTRGNSKTMLLNGSAVSEYKADQNELRLGVEANYGETEVTTGSGTNETKTTENNLNNVRAFGEYRRLLTERDYAYGRAEILHDEIASIDYKALVGPGLGRYLIKGDQQTLTAEAGATYIRWRQAGEDDDTIALRLAERYDLKVSATSKLWESVEYMPSFDDFGRYLLNAEVGAEAAMNTRLSLRAVLQDKYNSNPAPDKDLNDLTLIAALVYKL
jgi:putative salt-induced outer membrane protein YdiY